MLRRRLCARCWRLLVLYNEHGAQVTLLHGDARGADTIAHTIAVELGWSIRVYPPDYATYGFAAPLLRNLAMLDCPPDLVLAFQLDGSRGTQHTITEARRRGIPVEVHTVLRVDQR